MSRDRGQASVEIVACCAVLALAAIAIVQLLAIARTRVEAERIADQAAVLAAEGRPIPPALRVARRSSCTATGWWCGCRCRWPCPAARQRESVTTTIRP